jgi:peptidoglycan hydrolase-like protein with peptidoglycan-binding domain
MASQVYCQLSGPSGSIALGKSCTELTVGELIDEVSSLSLGEVWEGKVVNAFKGGYAAGTAVLWIRDVQTNLRYLLGCVNIATGGGYLTQYLDRPVQINKNMILESQTQAVV